MCIISLSLSVAPPLWSWRKYLNINCTTIRLIFVVSCELSPQLLDGLLWNMVYTFTPVSEISSYLLYIALSYFVTMSYI